MAIVKMEKINIVGIREEKQTILQKLQHLNCIEVIEPNKKLLSQILGETVYFEGKEKLEFDIAEIKFAIDFLNRYDTKNKPGMIQSFMGELTDVNKSDFDKSRQCDYGELIKDIKKTEIQLVAIERNKEKNNQQLEFLREWSNLTISIDQLRSLDNYNFVIGMLSKDKWHDFLNKLKDVTKSVAIEKIRDEVESKFQKLLIIFPKQPKDLDKAINQTLNEYKFQIAEAIFKYKDTVDNEIIKLKEQNKKLRKEKKELEDKIQIYIPKKLDLMCVYEQLSWQDNLKETQQQTILTQYTFILIAWVRADQLDMVKNELKKLTSNISMNILKPEKNEQPPVVLKNSKFIQPFEAVTNIYGMPKYSEPDPTAWLSPFFILFFALCLTDAGYGLIIIIITYLMLRKWNYLLIRLLNYGGWATLVIGTLTGGWFGVELDSLKWVWLADKLKYIRIVDPIKSPIVMMILALVLGIIQIWVGIACKMYWNLVNGRTKDALLDQFPWLCVFVILIGFSLSKAGILSIGQISTWQILLYIGLAIIIMTQGYKQKNIWLKLPSGILSLYDVVGFLSDTLSYARLLALGLATAIIAFVVNMIAQLAKGVPIVGIILFVVILIGGHTFNLCINLLGAFIHSARLQYVEFFSKFMEGGGRRFKPFSRKNTYINIK